MKTFEVTKSDLLEGLENLRILSQVILSSLIKQNLPTDGNHFMLLTGFKNIIEGCNEILAIDNLESDLIDQCIDVVYAHNDSVIHHFNEQNKPSLKLVVDNPIAKTDDRRATLRNVGIINGT